MKRKIVCLLMATVLLLALVMPAQAAEAEDGVRKTTTVEHLEDGSYFVIEVIQPVVATRSSQTSGYKTATYYSGTGDQIWQLELHGYFTYDGSSAKATSATAAVRHFTNKSATISKNAYVSGATAYAYASVNYQGTTTNKSIKLTCDRNGNMS